MLEDKVTADSGNSDKLVKYVLFGFLGLALLAGSAYAGYWYGTQRTKPIEPTPFSEPTTPTENQTKDWKTYEIEGVGTYKLPISVEKPRCDQSSCLSVGTYLPGGSRFTIAVHGKGRMLVDSWGELEKDLKEAGLTLGETSLHGKTARKFSGRPTEPFYFAPSSGIVEGFMISLNENLFIDVSIFAGDDKDVEFSNDQILFSQILPTFQFLN